MGQRRGPSRRRRCAWRQGKVRPQAHGSASRHGAAPRGTFRLSWFPILLAVTSSWRRRCWRRAAALPFLLRRQPEDGNPGTATRASWRHAGDRRLAIASAWDSPARASWRASEPRSSPNRGCRWRSVIYAPTPVHRGVHLARTCDGSCAFANQTPRVAPGARRARYLAYAMAAATGPIGFLMSTKPALW